MCGGCGCARRRPSPDSKRAVVDHTEQWPGAVAGPFPITPGSGRSRLRSPTADRSSAHSGPCAPHPPPPVLSPPGSCSTGVAPLLHGERAAPDCVFGLVVYRVSFLSSISVYLVPPSSCSTARHGSSRRKAVETQGTGAVLVGNAVDHARQRAACTAPHGSVQRQGKQGKSAVCLPPHDPSHA